eukprot:1790422-Prymnesium_polylepis.1
MALRRCVNAGAGGRAAERTQQLRAFRGLLARRHEDRVGLVRLQRQSVGWAAPACAVLSGARGVLWGRAEGCAAEGACVCV